MPIPGTAILGCYVASGTISQAKTCELIHSPGFFNELHTSERKHRYVSRIIRDVFHLTGAAMCKLTKTTMALAKEELKKGGYLHC